MQRVTGIGGVFFKARDMEVMKAWYSKHLGIAIEVWGGTSFRWNSEQNPGGVGTTVWSLFKNDTTYFGAAGSPFMINYRVTDLDAVLAALRAEGCDVDEKSEASEYGKFGWVTDPEGNRIELWQPPEGQ